MLSTPGVGSGLDISSIINQLMAIERQPLVALGTEQVELKAQLSAFGKLKSTASQFKSAMTELASADKYKYFKATSSDDKIISASADTTAGKGTYSIAVDRIAENHRLAASAVFSDTGVTKIGAVGDSMKIAVGADSFAIAIGDKTLAEIRDAINGAADNTGVTASILHDDAGYHLTLAADKTGSTSFVSAEYSSTDPFDSNFPGTDPFNLQALNADRDGDASFTSADLDAVITLENTFTVTSSSNTISDAIDGVTLTVGKAGSITLDVGRDNSKIQSSVQQLISSYNDVVKTVGELKNSVLSEERSSLRSFETQFRNVLNMKSGASEKFSFLFELGISTKLDGTLTMDTAVFNSALNNDPDGIPDLFANPTSGLAVRLRDLASEFTSAGGMLDGREQSLNSQIRSVEDQRLKLGYRLAQKEQALISQFSALDALLANLNTTSNFLTNQLDQIAAISKSSNGG